MPCPTCGHTLANLGLESERVFSCARCGTICKQKLGSSEFQDVYVPGIVESVRLFREAAKLFFDTSPWLVREWHACGLEAAIGGPGMPT